MRDRFLLDPDTVFLNHGSFGACPEPVFARYQAWQRELERNPVDFLGRRSGALLRQARGALAQWLGAAADDLAFVPNATTGVNTVARSLPFAPGDEILTTDHEYGACDATWDFVAARTGAVVKRVAIPLPFEPERVVDRVMAGVTPRTRLLFASHVSSTTALVFPVQDLCRAARERGVPTLIDGAHAPGQVPLDGDLDLAALGADWFTGNLHKWLCAPKGAAFLHARPERQALLQAPVVSWGYVAGVDGAAASGPLAGHTGFDAYTGRTPLERRLQWQGTRDIAAYLAVPEALAFAREHLTPAARRACHALACATRDRVLARNGLAPVAPDAAHGQMVPIPVRATDAEGLRATLFERFRIEVPVTQHAGHTFVRLSVQVYNTPAEMDRLVAALAELGV